MNSMDELEKEEEENICLMGKHEDNKVNNLTSYFTYHKLFFICTILDSESGKLKKNIISSSKSTISFLEK